MLNRFYPDEYLESVYAIDFEELKKKGYQGFLFDIDNTLVSHGAPADEKIIGFFASLQKLGLEYCLISNNKLPRVKSFADQINAKFIENARKPLGRNYQVAMKMMGCDTTNSIFVGDQIFTDIYGAKRIGMRTILVKPIHPGEEIQIVLKRYLERIVLYFYERSKK